MAELLQDPADLRDRCDGVRRTGQKVGLVPTMGALHEGHLSLIHAARKAGADAIGVTIFVNPLQFGANEDLDRYPRTLEADIALLEPLGVDWVFAPRPSAMYPSDFQTHVDVTGVTAHLEGASRPDHFRGVTTVVTKLFNIAAPCVAAFGRKDYQQWRTVTRMVEDLNMPIEVLGCPIVREADGLALSSRNRYLDPQERTRALSLYSGLLAAQRLFLAGERRAATLIEAARGPVDAQADRVDYVTLVDPVNLEPIEADSGPTATLLMAAHVGRTRLIDNTILGQDVLPTG